MKALHPAFAKEELEILNRLVSAYLDIAEVNALRAAGARGRGATAYVTLMPCAHFGKTPPCTRALIAAGILYLLGSGPVKGFAATLGIGILTSVFTAFVVTRWLTVMWIKTFKTKKLSV